MALSSSEPRKKSTDVGHGLLIIQLCVSGHVGGWCAVVVRVSLWGWRKKNENKEMRINSSDFVG